MLLPAEFDPITMNLTPLLIEEIPIPEPVNEGPHAGGEVYTMKFRSIATWSDKKPVTAEDYLFTIKSVYNPHLNIPSYKAFFDFISEVVIDSTDNTRVSVYIDEPYMLALASVTNFHIYPSHLYDPEQIMAKFSLKDLRDPEKKWTAEEDALLKKFAADFESPKYLRETVTGSGPYELESWVTGEYIKLKRKEDWWGDQIKDAPLLMVGYPKEITYRIILDNAAALAALKAGEIDLMAEVPAADFISMKNDPEWKDKFHFENPPITQVNYIELNARDSILADPRIRQALAYTIDYDGLVNQLLKGLATRTVGPFHPDKSYYNKELKPITQDVKKSLELIKEAGWEDTNQNGTPDKVIGGKREELKIVLKVSNKGEGNAVATIVKDNAKQAGIDVEIVAEEPSQFTQDVKQFNFDAAVVRSSTYPTDDDPYQNWHSTSDQPGGSNRTGYHTAELDSLIELLRTSEDKLQRENAYKQFQENLYRDQPAIWLYVPLERIIASKRIKLITSSRRPGYFENLLMVAE